MFIGTVKWFDKRRGYGFLTHDKTGEEYFVHYTSIAKEGFKELEEGQKVTFNTVTGPKGTSAVNVSVLSEDAVRYAEKFDDEYR